MRHYETLNHLRRPLVDPRYALPAAMPTTGPRRKRLCAGFVRVASVVAKRRLAHLLRRLRARNGLSFRMDCSYLVGRYYRA